MDEVQHQEPDDEEHGQDPQDAHRLIPQVEPLLVVPPALVVVAG